MPLTELDDDLKASAKTEKIAEAFRTILEVFQLIFVFYRLKPQANSFNFSALEKMLIAAD